MDPSVLRALRLGWRVAELRGRYREMLKLDPDSPAARFDRKGNPLPLQEERSTKELAIEVERAVVVLAGELNLTIDGAALKEKTTAAQAAVGGKGWPAAWNALTEHLYHIDAAFQDGLYADALPSAAAYQLGRGLAEVTWALDPGAEVGSTSLLFLLGEERVQTMKRLLQRLRQSIDEVTSYAVASTLDAWAAIASGWAAAAAAARKENDPAKKAAAEAACNATLRALRDQARVWHDMLLDQVPWQTLIDPKAAIRRRPSLAPLKPFWPELALAALGVAGLVIALGLLSLRSQGGLAAVVAVLSATGVTAASVRARIKDQAQNLIGQMQRAFNMELAAEAILRVPAPPAKPTPAIRRLLPGATSGPEAVA